MKIRNGFVSNSSSSSFIVSMTSYIDICPHCYHTKGITQLELTELLNGSDNDTELYNTDYTSKEFMRDLGQWWDEEDAARISNRLDNKLDSEIIMYFSVGYNSEWLSDKIKKADNISIIYGENE